MVIKALNAKTRYPARPTIKMVDFFSGCGGASAGFAKAGIRPVVAIDNDLDSVATYRANFPETTVIEDDIRNLSPRALLDLLPSEERAPTLFVGCSPCQPFADYQKGEVATDDRSFLLFEFLRFINALNPELVFIENVSGVRRPRSGGGIFTRFVEELSRTHDVSYGEILCADYGVPQVRRRLVLLASRLGRIGFPRPTHGPLGQSPHSTVREWIGDLPPIAAGENHPEVPNHRASRLSALNAVRISLTPEGGDWRNWPEHLWGDRHRKGFRGHTDSYGRLTWDRAAPTLTTRCISYSNGRYGHPEQDRGLSVREAALLQTFPSDFVFMGTLNSQARQVGNAVPVKLAERFGHHYREHMERVGWDQVPLPDVSQSGVGRLDVRHQWTMGRDLYT